MAKGSGRDETGTLGGAGRAARAGLMTAGRAGARGVRALARLAAKLIVTVWRLAGALDAALWRGAKLVALTLWGALALVAKVAAGALTDLIRWLPTQAGRAYSAVAGVILIVAGLWIIDELRADGARQAPQGQERAPVDPDDPILARIEGRYVRLSEVEAFARASGALRDDESLTPQAAHSRELVQAYVEQRLLARAALEAGLHRTPETARRLVAARERILAADYMQARIEEAVTEEAIRRLYAAQADVTRLGDEVRARHIVVETGEEAETLLAELEGGADFAALARARSLDRATAPYGGEIGWFTRDMMAPALAAAAFSTPPGEMAAPFRTEFGWHVLEVLDRRPTQGVPLAAVRDNIRRFLTLRTIERTLARLKEAHEVVYYPPEDADEALKTEAAPEDAVRPTLRQ
ncbi:peptidylprolyl isomerase [Amphiplicatus metriothermophilus]|uniref:Parvulin-like PPIase n=1 Tax=Amphiplicatus metriothermophilus TaxID=1519374 RepID=A0A239PIZ5_9PROT|nr:peptidylprolyl isomerase [Amphiplicatus metriothermophilus]MBB5517884.1 parvulin-like peptidyl-prolyl isomerase [Amphiplicatus metriothermophilus]SNT67782.1 Parvulin-like peptidyl-prolyl isomerase [Amphiplicatus metriothermophilus]